MSKSETITVRVCFIDARGRRHEVVAATGLTVMQAAVAHGVAGIDAICGGACSCATCHVYVDAPWYERVGPPLGAELELLFALDESRDDSRLGCQVTLVQALDGMTLRVPAAA